MTRLRQCSTEVIGSIKKMFTCLIKDAFKYRFKFQCPKYLCRVRDLSFLPHLLQCQMSWHEVTLSQLTFALEIPPNDLDMVLMQPSGLRRSWIMPLWRETLMELINITPNCGRISSYNSSAVIYLSAREGCLVFRPRASSRLSHQLLQALCFCVGSCLTCCKWS